MPARRESNAAARSAYLHLPWIGLREIIKRLNFLLTVIKLASRVVSLEFLLIEVTPSLMFTTFMQRLRMREMQHMLTRLFEETENMEDDGEIDREWFRSTLNGGCRFLSFPTCSLHDYSVFRGRLHILDDCQTRPWHNTHPFYWVLCWNYCVRIRSDIEQVCCKIISIATKWQNTFSIVAIMSIEDRGCPIPIMMTKSTERKSVFQDQKDKFKFLAATGVFFILVFPSQRGGMFALDDCFVLGIELSRNACCHHSHLRDWWGNFANDPIVPLFTYFTCCSMLPYHTVAWKWNSYFCIHQKKSEYFWSCRQEGRQGSDVSSSHINHPHCHRRRSSDTQTDLRQITS